MSCWVHKYYHIVSVRSNLFAEIKNRDDNKLANEIVICTLVPPTTREPGSS